MSSVGPTAYTAAMRNKIEIALVVLGVVLASSQVRSEISIEQLVRHANIIPGKTAIRDMPNWSAARKIIIRDMGLDLSDIAAAHSEVKFILVSSAIDASQFVSDADAIVGYCDADLIAAANRLVWVQIFHAGAERCLAVEKIASGDVVFTNMQKMSSPVIAEHAISMMLALHRNLPRFARGMDKGDWARTEESTAGMRPTAGKTLLVLGLGGIGTEVARLGAALNMRVIATRNSSRFGPDFVDYVGLSNELLTLAAQADVIVNAMPLTDATEGLLGKEFFASTKHDAVFINVGRGKTVVTDDLVMALESGSIAGAGLDVTEPEPLPGDHPLWAFGNVLITPHVSSRGDQFERHRVLLIENLRRYVAGDPLLNTVDPEKGY